MARCSVLCDNRKLAEIPVDDDVIIISESEDEEFVSCVNDAVNNTITDEKSGIVDSGDASTKTVFSVECLHDQPSDPETLQIDLSDESSHEVQASIKTEPIDDSEVPESQKDLDSESRSVLMTALTGKDCVSLSTNHHQSNTYSNTTFEGKHNFKISMPTKTSLKPKDYVFCPKQNKVYVSIDQVFEIYIKAEDVPEDAFVRVFAVYSDPVYQMHCVKRCPSHEHMDLSKGSVLYQHFVQSMSNLAIYKQEKDMFSVSMPYEQPAVGTDYSCYLFRLTCFSSCFGGIDRRQISLVLSLETEEEILGRQSLNVKVCANPIRDYLADLKRLNLDFSVSACESESLKSSRESKNGVYAIKVKDFDLYVFLRDMKTLYETGTFVQQFNPGSKNG